MSEKKLVRRNVVFPSGVAWIILIAGLVGATAFYTSE